MINLVDMESQVITRARADDLRGAIAIVLPCLESEDRLIRGWARYTYGKLQFMESPRLAVDALRSLDVAIEVLPTGSQHIVRACVEAVHVSLFRDDVTKAGRYCDTAMALIDDGYPECLPWEGRVLLARSQQIDRHAELLHMTGDHRRGNELYARAAIMAERSARFYAKNAGPFPDSSTDRPCQIRLGLTMQADILWSAGKRNEACAIMKPLLAQMPKETNPVVLMSYAYWMGHTALLDNRLDEARMHLTDALASCRRLSDHRLTSRTVVALVEVLNRSGRRSEVEPLVTPLVMEAAAAQNAYLVDRLQVALHHVLVGRDDGEETLDRSAGGRDGACRRVGGRTEGH